MNKMDITIRSICVSIGFLLCLSGAEDAETTWQRETEMQRARDTVQTMTLPSIGADPS